MSDLQPGTNDIVIGEAQSGYVVSVFGSARARLLCRTLPDALSAAQEYARRDRVDVWFAENDSAWRVRRYGLNDDAEVAEYGA